ncbi:MAG: hypothetical protein ACTSXQ_05625 [Alphaproteobacteria bacterium]
MKDKFYEDICDRLEKLKIDGDLFEECMSDLFAKHSLLLSPVTGGCDGGIDGDFSLTPLDSTAKLISTTGEDAIGNLTKSLKQILKEGIEKSRNVIFVTSKKLTTTRRKNLKTRANSLGFELLNIFTQEGVANYIYYDSIWCKKLLGISGNPPPLSKIPQSHRPPEDTGIIGREEDYEELLEMLYKEKDTLIYGQPGSGKTYFLFQLIKDQDAYFLNSTMKGVPDFLRENQVDFIIIDDAHLKKELLENLLHFRKDGSHGFKIVMTTWPTDLEEMQTLYEISSDQCYYLKQLGQDKIIEVIKSNGILGPNSILNLIVKQSSGKPGLATMLTKLCYTSDYQKVISGEKLSSFIISKVTKSHSTECAKEILATFAIYGAQGGTLNDVAIAMDLTALEVRNTISGLDQLGILSDSKERIVVMPEDLRYALVKEVYFNGPRSLAPDRFIQDSKKDLNILNTLIGVLKIGGKINEDEIYQNLIENGNIDCKKHFASIGLEQTKNLLKQDPGLITDLSAYALHFIPETAVLMLLSKAEKETIKSLENPEHPLREIESWIKSAVPGTGEVKERKKILTQAIVRGLGDELTSPQSALPFVFNSIYDVWNLSPGSGRQVTSTFGLITVEESQVHEELWETLLPALKKLEENILWYNIFKILEDLTIIYSPGAADKTTLLKQTRKTARVICRDLIPLVENHSGASQSLYAYMSDLSMKEKKEVKLNDDFEMLYPKNDLNIHKRGKHYDSLIKNLSKKYIEQGPSKASKEILLHVKHASDIKKTYPDLTHVLYKEIAENIHEHTKWIKAIRRNGGTPIALWNFLTRLPDSKNGFLLKLAKGSFLERFIQTILRREKTTGELSGLVTQAVLRKENPKGRLLKYALTRLGEEGRPSIRDLIFSKPSEKVQNLLLSHSRTEVAGEAAVYLYSVDRNKSLPENLIKKWETAIVNYEGHQKYWHSEIFSQNHSLCFRWMKRRIEEDTSIRYSIEDIFKVASNLLSTNEKIEVLEKLFPENQRLERKTQLIVGNDPDAFEFLLTQAHLKKSQLSPLEGKEGKALIDFIKKVPCDTYSSDTLANACMRRTDGWTGNKSDVLKTRILGFENLKKDAKGRCTEVINKIIQSLTEEKERCLKYEHLQDVYGR